MRARLLGDLDTLLELDLALLTGDRALLLDTDLLGVEKLSDE